MLRKLLFIVALGALSPQGFALDVYRIANRDTSVTRYRKDLVTLIDLNAHSVQSKVRAFYKQLLVQRSLVNLQPGDLVKVSVYYDDGTAQIDFSDKHGYIAKEDLTQQLKAQ